MTTDFRKLWVVYATQNGVRHVYGPARFAAVSPIYTSFQRYHADLNIDGPYGIKTEEAFLRDEALNKSVREATA